MDVEESTHGLAEILAIVVTAEADDALDLVARTMPAVDPFEAVDDAVGWRIWGNTSPV